MVMRKYLYLRVAIDNFIVTRKYIDLRVTINTYTLLFYGYV